MSTITPDLTAKDVETYSLVARLAEGQSLAKVAVQMGLPLPDVERRAHYFGWPDTYRVKAAADVLWRRIAAERAATQAPLLVQRADELVADRFARKLIDGEPHPHATVPQRTFLDRYHPLASIARHACAAADHHIGLLVGGVACGACWEAAIRADERRAGAAKGAAA